MYKVCIYKRNTKISFKIKELKAVKIRPISTDNLKLKAKRPSYSSLDSKKYLI